MIRFHPELVANRGLLAATALGLTVGMLPALFYSMGTLIPVWEVEFGWSRGDMSLALTLVTLAMFLGGPAAGRLGDRFGAARVGSLSLLIYGVGLMLLAMVLSELWQLWVGYVALAAVGVASTAIVLVRPIAAAFEVRRGIAMGIALTGAGVAGFWVPQTVAWIIAVEGWRVAMFTLGALACLAAPLVWVGFRGRRDTGPAVPLLEHGSDFLTAFHSRQFWVLSFMGLAMSLGVGGLVVHFVPLFTDLGADPLRAAEIASILGLASVAGRMGVGALLDRLPAILVTLGALLIAAAGAMLLYLFQLAFAVPGVMLLELAAGAEVDLIAYLCARYFGTRAYGTIYGWQYSIFVLGYGFSPWIVGRSRDVFGTYEPALLASAAAIAAAGVLATLLGRAPQRRPDSLIRNMDLPIIRSSN